MDYSSEELTALKTLFDSCDSERSGRIHINQLPGLLSKLGKTTGLLLRPFSFITLIAFVDIIEETIKITEEASRIADENEGQIRFNDFVSVLEKLETTSQVPLEGPDPKVIEFLRILEEYRVKCEEEGNYLEAGRAHKQLGILRKQEEKRQQKAIRARQISERQDVQLAHNMQFSEFNAAWDKYMEEYDNMAQMYIQQMTERHAVVLLEFQKHLRNELSNKPPKWSRELLDQRRKQHINARNKMYAEAQKLKKVCDRIEEKERREMEQEQAIVFARREAKFRQQQQTELQALLKRIECRRKEHIKQRNLDSKRLLQRNRNVQTVLESKQNVESHRMFESIKKTLNHNGNAVPGGISMTSSSLGASGPRAPSPGGTSFKQKANRGSGAGMSWNDGEGKENDDDEDFQSRVPFNGNDEFLNKSGPDFSGYDGDDFD